MPHLPARRLRRHPLSGHCHRVELLLSIFELQLTRVEALPGFVPMQRSPVHV